LCSGNRAEDGRKRAEGFEGGNEKKLNTESKEFTTEVAESAEKRIELKGKLPPR